MHVEELIQKVVKHKVWLLCGLSWKLSHWLSYMIACILKPSYWCLSLLNQQCNDIKRISLYVESNFVMNMWEKISPLISTKSNKIQHSQRWSFSSWITYWKSSYKVFHFGWQDGQGKWLETCRVLEYIHWIFLNDQIRSSYALS